MLECAWGREPELFRIGLIPQTFVGQVLLYAKTTGIFKKMHLKHATHQKTILSPCVFLGKEILHLKEQFTCIEILLTTRTNSQTALLNALLEANKINLIIEK